MHKLFDVSKALSSHIYRPDLIIGMFMLLTNFTAYAVPTGYSDETEFHNALALLGYTATHEGFEDDVAWADARSTYLGGFNAAESVSSLGMTWSSNSDIGQVTTGWGAGRTGIFGFYSYPHGSYGSPDTGRDCTLPGECGDGWRGTANSGKFLAMGGYIDTNTPYTSLGMFLGKYPTGIPVDFGETCDIDGNICWSNSIVGTSLQFYGVIDPDGFTAFEYRDMEGTAEDGKLLFSDDFYFVIVLPPPEPIPAVLLNPRADLITTELGGTATFNVVLTTQPTANVEITLISSDPVEGIVSPSVMTFSSSNWDTIQTALITGQDDVVTDGNVAYDITITVSASSDSDYAALPAQLVEVTNIDDDTACCEIVYVDENATGGNNGQNWTDAYTDIQLALAGISSGEIWVAAGSYKPGAAPENSFQMRDQVALFGGFNGTETQRDQRDSATNLTILNGDLQDDDVSQDVDGHVKWGNTTDNSHHVVTSSFTDDTALLDGFVLAHGNAVGALVTNGGGLIIDNASPRLRNIQITGSAADNGGGAYVLDGSPSFSDCVFSDNYAEPGQGGAIYIGGTSAVTFTNCYFNGNAAIGSAGFDGDGGAVYTGVNTTVTFTGSTFIGNLADHGGAIYADNALTLINNVFNGNQATTDPTGDRSQGGALILNGLSQLIGNTITANKSEKDAGGIYVGATAVVTMANNILWGNIIPPIPDEDVLPIAKEQLEIDVGGQVNMRYGIFEGLYQDTGEDPPEPAKYPGVLDTNPMFDHDIGIDGTAGTDDDDLRPGYGSPAVDSGDNNAVPGGIVTDIDGNQRFQDDPAVSDTGMGGTPIVDMGAYERTPACTASKVMSANLWLTFALPCSPFDRTVAGVFTAGSSILKSSDYNLRWVVYVYENFDYTAFGGYPQGYTKLALTDELEAGKGYFYYSLDMSAINVSGEFNSGVDMPLRTEQSSGIFNLVGNPNNTSVLWPAVMVDDAGSMFTWAEADPGDTCDPAPALTTCLMWHVMNKWESTAYQTYDGIAHNPGTLDPFDAVWVRAHRNGISLRTPDPVIAAFVQTPTAVAADLNLKSGFDPQKPEKTNSKGGRGSPWYVRLVAESGTYRDNGNWLGQLEGVKDKLDSRDLEELYPHGEPYLSILFTNPKFGQVNWGYTTDYRKLTNKQKGEWPFVVRASGGISTVTLSWQGEAALFEHAILVDEVSGKIMSVLPDGSYSFNLSGGEHQFRLIFD